MPTTAPAARAAVPSVDRVLRLARLEALIARHGRPLATEATRAVLARLRARLAAESNDAAVAGALMDVKLCGDGICYFNSGPYATDSNGLSKFKLLKAASTTYWFTVIGLSHGSYSYADPSSLDVENPESFPF